ncbi:GNAT family N-acetyltransferase [Ornithinicoccus halotolerans]|uniref:GNAT family N-acetyltransferase n=1 Tax=Ornithinicoccus halotolerans TaxID=1748220 RepID=UPI0012980976|nr:GNAT family protein [Ornithinicoccus halotolerans]
MRGWPARLEVQRPEGDTIVLRGLRRSDRRQWQALRERNGEWLRRWEATYPTGPVRESSFWAARRAAERAAAAGQLVPFVVEADGVLVGQMHLFEVVWGSRWSATAGYWLDRQATGRGIATWALAMAIEHGLLRVGLHRVEVNVRPENTASLAVVRRLQLREEGRRRGLIHVDGDWRDHLSFAVLAEEVTAGTLLARAAGASGVTHRQAPGATG